MNCIGRNNLPDAYRMGKMPKVVRWSLMLGPEGDWMADSGVPSVLPVPFKSSKKEKNERETRQDRRMNGLRRRRQRLWEKRTVLGHSGRWLGCWDIIR